MTRGPKLQLAALFAATVALGVPWGWVPVETTAKSQLREENSLAEEASPQAEPFEKDASPILLAEENEGRPALGEAAPERPHPITPAHEAMSQRREVLGAAVAAIQKKEYESARRWLSEADELGEAVTGADGLEDVRGYRLILECLDARARERELPNSLLEASKKYIEERRLPPRREVRRVCLEGRPFARRA